jgi:hypothetical protein
MTAHGALVLAVLAVGLDGTILSVASHTGGCRRWHGGVRLANRQHLLEYETGTSACAREGMHRHGGNNVTCQRV